MRSNLLVILLVASLGGCYVGRTAPRKAIAYAVNGGLVVVGAAGMTSAQEQSDDAQIATMLSAVPLVLGLAGIALNLAVPTEHEALVTAKPVPANAFSFDVR